MKPPTPNSTFFHAHPPQPCDEDGKPLKTRLREPKRSIKRNVLAHPNAKRPPMREDQGANERLAERAGAQEWVDELPPRKPRGPTSKTRELVELLKAHPGRWRRLGQIKVTGGFNSLRRAGCEIATRRDADGKRYAFARWPEGK